MKILPSIRLGSILGFLKRGSLSSKAREDSIKQTTARQRVRF